MNAAPDWQPVSDFWFPERLLNADLETHRSQLAWWMAGGANAELGPFAALTEKALAGELDNWRSTPLGRLCLIIVLDQFTRGLFSGNPRAYAGDPSALRLAEEGLRNGHYDALKNAWEKIFYLMAISHAEGPDHLERMDRIVTLQDDLVAQAPASLESLFRFHCSQARGHRETILHFGRFPHRNAILGRASTPEEEYYLEKGDYVFNRRPPGDEA